MQPENLNFGGGVAETAIGIPVILLTIVCCLVILLRPRPQALVAFMVAAIMTPTDQVAVLGGLHFPVVRILLVAGFIRLVREKIGGEEIFSGGLNAMDKFLLALLIFTAVDGMLLWQTSGYIVFALGSFYSSIGVYCLWRFLVRTDDDIRRALRILAIIVTAVAVIMLFEQLTGQNFYYKLLGGASANRFGAHLEVRDGKLRARGVFAHPILAGTFGGFCFPLFVGLWWRGVKEDRRFAALGMVASLVPPFAANSSTALFGLLGGIIGLGFWGLRHHMRLIRWGIVSVLVSLHLVMNGPVWQLIDRVSLKDSSSSYHRYQLVNQCILHYKDWFLIGTKNYGDWGWDMWDLSNAYVGTADTVGFVPLVAFIAIIVVAYRYVGLARRACDGDRSRELYLWAFGASLFANTVAFMGIGYFDQTFVAWYGLLAMISATTLAVRNPSAVPAAMPGISGIAPAPKGKLMPGWNRPKPAGTVANGLSTRPMASRIGSNTFANHKPAKV
jgi:hypothetical protein